MRCSFGLAALAALASSTYGRVYYEETFSDPASLDTFIATEARSDLGAIKLSKGKWFSDDENSIGLQVSEDARFYAYSAKLNRPFNTKGKDFIVQFTVKYEQDIDCGGAYLKLLPPTLDPAKFDGESEYEVMFGPDICGSTNRRVHAIINYNGTNNQIDKVVQPRGDQLTHQYTFWVKPDKTFEIRIDNKVQEEGKIEEFWKVLPEKQVADPDAKKPEEWVDGPAMIEDPEDEKPEDWVDGPETVPDTEAQKPEDWDDDMDGDWEAPVVANPEYKGEWKPRMIKNPEYQGEWSAPLIDNPNYEDDEDLAVFNIGYIGLDVWTVKSGTIFDNILITDDIDYASQFGNSTWVDYVEKEIEVKKAIDEEEAEKLEAERKVKEEERKAKEEAEKEKAEDADELDENDDVKVDAAEPVEEKAEDESVEEKAEDESDEEKAEDESDEEKAEDESDEEKAEDESDEEKAEDESDEEKAEDESDEEKAEDEAVEESIVEESIVEDEEVIENQEEVDEEKVAEEKAAEEKAAEEKAAEEKAAEQAKADKKAAKRAAAKEAAEKAKQAAEAAQKAAEEAELEDEDEKIVHDEL